MEGETEKRLFCLLVHVTNDYNGLSLAAHKPGTRSFLQVWHLGPGPQGSMSYSDVFPGHEKGIGLERRSSNQDMNLYLDDVLVRVGGWLAQYTTAPPQEEYFFMRWRLKDKVIVDYWNKQTLRKPKKMKDKQATSTV